MPTKDLHETPFDQETITKLEIFESYAQEWIPTFVLSKQSISIFDFFAGGGYDVDGTPGSPIRVLKKIREQIGRIFQSKIKVDLYLNELKLEKFRQLETSVSAFMNENREVARAVKVHFYQKNFSEVFFELAPKIGSNPSLVFIDQNGIQFLNPSYITILENAPKTDFLFFFSSSYFWRFGNTPEFKKHISIDLSKAKKNPYKHINRNIIAQIRENLDPSSNLKLYPFSLKEKNGPNINAIIFGATHPRAVDKFLQIAWRKNHTNGEANFDIDEDMKKSQFSLFEEKKLTKIESFKDLVRSKVLGGELKTNEEVFHFSLSEGHIASHAKEVLIEMKKNQEIFFGERSPFINYEAIYNNNRIVHFLRKAAK
jgi:three-Cys-motif partner protein